MDDIFNIKLPIEASIKEEVIVKFSNKQGGGYNIFSYYWECYAWAATIGFIRNERRLLESPTERVFSLNTMRNGGGEKIVQALICMCIARAGRLDIMKDPDKAVTLISEYANGGFYYIKSLMKNGENTFNDFEKVKQEVFSRNYDMENGKENREHHKKLLQADQNNADIIGVGYQPPYESFFAAPNMSIIFDFASEQLLKCQLKSFMGEWKDWQLDEQLTNVLVSGLKEMRDNGLLESFFQTTDTPSDCSGSHITSYKLYVLYRGREHELSTGGSNKYVEVFKYVADQLRYVDGWRQ